LGLCFADSTELSFSWLYPLPESQNVPGLVIGVPDSHSGTTTVKGLRQVLKPIELFYVKLKYW